MISFLYTLYRFGRGIRTAWSDANFRALLTLVVVIVGIGTIVYRTLEGLSWTDALYFSVTTITTVGYGDIAPHTTAGKMFTIVYILVGLGLLLSMVTTLAGHAVREHKDRPGSFGEKLTRRRRAIVPEKIVSEIPMDPAQAEMQAEVEKADVVR